MASLGNISSTQTPAGDPVFSVDLESRYRCLVCKNVLRDAMQTTCGHKICENCIPKLFEGKSEPVMCPANEEDCLEQRRCEITPDSCGRREVRKLKVFCSSKDRGCLKILMWKDLELHDSKCEHRPAQCPNGCTDCVAFNNLDNHVANECQYRLVPCRHCNEQVPFCKQEEHIQQACMNVDLSCPYKCGHPTMKRLQLIEHIENCPNKPKECKFKSIGCQFTGTEKEVADHMAHDLNDHLEKVTVFTASVDVQSMQIRRQLQEVTTERDQLRQQVQQQTAEIDGVKENAQRLANANKELKMKMVSLTERIIHLERKAEDSAKKEVVDRHDRDVRAIQTSLTQVRTQVATLDRQSLTGGNRGTGGGGADPEQGRRLDLHDGQFAQLNVQLAEFELRLQNHEKASYDGTILWNLQDYTRRKQEAIAGKTLSLYSQPFYTHRHGYKMCAQVYLNGDGEGRGSHMSLFFVIMRGEYDVLLPWPFQQKVTMILIDQENPEAHHSCSFQPHVGYQGTIPTTVDIFPFIPLSPKMEWMDILFNDGRFSESDTDTDKSNNSKVEQVHPVSPREPMASTSAEKGVGKNKADKTYWCNSRTYNSRSRGNKQIIHKIIKMQCDSCSKEFAERYDLKEHRNSIHENNKFMCEVCSKCLNTRFTLRRHKLTVHTKEAKFTCALCTKQFYEKATYLGHINNHAGVKPYECSQCKKGFALKYSIRCPRCAKTFSWSSSLTRHCKTCR